MNVYVATRNPIKLQAVRDAFTEWHRDVGVNVVAVDPPAGLPEQPLGEQVAHGAIARAKAAVDMKDAEYGVGIEAGLLQLPGSDRWLSLQICAMIGRDGRISLGVSPGYELPEDLRKAVLSGTGLREALRLRRGVDDAEHRRAIHLLSDERLDRYTITRDAVQMALVGVSSNGAACLHEKPDETVSDGVPT